MDNNQKAIYNLKCNCGYTHWGLIRDDPSCVIETANEYLKYLLNEHIKQSKIRESNPGCYSYEATIRPCRKDESDAP
jgi:hypothetical protein